MSSRRYYYPTEKRMTSILCADEDLLTKYVNDKGEYEPYFDPSFHNYEKEVGYHMNDKLALYAIKNLIHSSKDTVVDKETGRMYWTKPEVLGVLSKSNLSLPEHIHICDFWYFINAEKAVHNGNSITNVTDLFKHAIEDVNSYYDGQIFLEFVTKHMKLGEPICWDEMI